MGDFNLDYYFIPNLSIINYISEKLAYSNVRRTRLNLKCLTEDAAFELSQDKIGRETIIV